jgi:hypothetical protein
MMTSMLSKQRIQSVLDSWGAKGCSVSLIQQRPEGSWVKMAESAGIRNKQGAEVEETVSDCTSQTTQYYKSMTELNSRHDS